MSTPNELPDCEDATLDALSPRVQDMATQRANCAVGDCRPGKRMDLHAALGDLVHHETRSAYLAGYSQATKDSQERITQIQRGWTSTQQEKP